MDDVRAVMDAVGSERAALFGISEGGPMCQVFAATYPQRTDALVLFGTFARYIRAPDYHIGMPAEALGKFAQRIEETWGRGFSADVFAPSLANDAAFRQSWARFERFAVSPAGFLALMRMLYETDARAVLPVIRVPLSSSTDRATGWLGSKALVTWQSAFWEPSTWSCLEQITSPGSGTSTRSSTRSKSS